VTVSGTPPYVAFRDALDRGDLARVRRLATAMPRVGPSDAPRICLLMRNHDSYESVATRWLGRFALEGGDVTIADVQAAAAALDALPYQSDETMERLYEVCSRAARDEHPADLVCRNGCLTHGRKRKLGPASQRSR
jgi:hypothetical protein